MGAKRRRGKGEVNEKRMEEEASEEKALFSRFPWISFRAAVFLTLFNTLRIDKTRQYFGGVLYQIHQPFSK